MLVMVSCLKMLCPGSCDQVSANHKRRVQENCTRACVFLQLELVFAFEVAFELRKCDEC